MAGPGGTPISAAPRVRGCQEPAVGEGADQRPHRDGDAEPIPVAHCGTGEQVQRVPERGPLRRRPDQQLAIDRGGTVHPPPVQPLGMRVADAAQPSSDGGFGPPEPSCDGAVSGPAGVRDQGVPDRLGAVRAAHGQRGRQQDLGDPSVSAASPSRGHGDGVGTDAANGAGPAVAERAQHTPTPRAGQFARQQHLFGHFGARHHHHNTGLRSCQPALPTTADVDSGHFVLQATNSHRLPSRCCRPSSGRQMTGVSPAPATARRGRFPSSSQ